MENNSNPKNNSLSSLSIVFSFSIVSIYITLNPKIFVWEPLMYLILLISVGMSIFGLILEAQKFFANNFKGEKIEFDNLLAGLFILLLFFLFTNYLSSEHWLMTLFLDFLNVTLLLFASAGILDGLIKLLKSIKSNERGESNSFYKTLNKSGSFLLALVSFIAAIVAILDSFGIIGKS